MDDNTRSNNDVCYRNNKDKSNYDRLKFSTTSFTDLIDAQQNNSYSGIPTDKIDMYSQLLNGVRSEYNTKCYQTRGTNNPLPLPTLPGKYNTAHGDITVEDGNLRGNDIRQKNPLRYVPNNDERIFDIFSENVIRPSNFVEKTSRNGQQTRF